jgi:hypothetical protein
MATDPLREALEACEAALLLGIGWCDGPNTGHETARLRMHDARGKALAALEALAASPVPDACDHVAELREARAIAGLAMTFIPADQFERFEERCRAILLDPAALVADRPVRVEWQVVPADNKPGGLRAPNREEAFATWRVLDGEDSRYVVQTRQAAGPWQDVTDEGDGDAA